MIALIDPSFWVEKIKSECPIFESRALETLDDDSLALEMVGMPAALIYLSNDNSDAGQMTGITSQKHNIEMTVKIAIRKETSKYDRLCAEESRLIRNCRLEVFKALIGWTPPDCQAPVEHISGTLTAKEQLYLWTDTFGTFDYLRQ